MDCSMPGFPVLHYLLSFRSLLKLMSIESMMPSKQLILCCPLLPLPYLSQHQGLFQCHSSKASILLPSTFFIVQLSHPYVTTGKAIALTRWTSVGKVMSVLFNMLSRLVIAFLPRINCLLISWLQSPSAVILEPSKIKPVTDSTVSLSICH